MGSTRSTSSADRVLLRPPISGRSAVARMPRLVACAALWASSLSAQGDSLYTAWCSHCHGADARGTPAATTRLEVPPADLASCAASTAETENRWVGIVTRGGAAYGLSPGMPASRRG